MKTITNIMLEFIDIGKDYRNTDDKQRKRDYEDHVNLVIENDAEARDRNSLYSYWEGLKKGD